MTDLVLNTRQAIRRIDPVLAFIALLVVTTAVNPNFLFSTDGWRDLTLTPAILVCLAIGQAPPVTSGKQDDLQITPGVPTAMASSRGRAKPS